MSVDVETPAARAHLERTVRTWLGVSEGADRTVPELPTELARLLLRAEEYERAHRDRWDCWEFAYSDNYRRGQLWVPEVDRWLLERRRELAASVPLEPLWPDGRQFAVCMSHDVDLVSRASTPRQALRSMRTSLADRPTTVRGRALRLARPAVRAARAASNGISAAPLADTLERAAQLELDRGVRASYFFTVYPGRDSSRYDCTYDFGDPCRFRGERMRIADVVRTLHEDGFDVGLHGSYNSALVPGLLARERTALETATDLTVSTTRQHFLHWQARTTPRLQHEAGFRADSSLGFNRNLGFRAGTSLPFRWFDLERAEPLDLLELPILVQDGTLLRSDALELDVELAWNVTRQLVDEAAEVGGVATFVVHPNNLEHDRHLELFVRALDYCGERGAWFASLRDLDEWWRERERKLSK
jgi:hypothetical protein